MENISLQLYSLHKDCEDDFKGTLKKVAEMGYAAVEYAGYWGLSPQELKTYMDEIGLKSVSSHVSLKRLEENLEEELEYAKTLGYDYIICPMHYMQTRQEAIDLAARLNGIAETCAKAGISFGYHNHDFEFKKDEDEYLFDILFQNCSELVLAEIDVYWVSFAGADAIETIRKYAGRAPLIHLKELGYQGEEKYNTTIGKGVLNFPEIVSVAKMLGAEHFIVEQEPNKFSEETQLMLVK
ncbi:MAG: hypothetical protein BGN88_15780, partial [Clostridiales bacterium 43-6]